MSEGNGAYEVYATSLNRAAGVHGVRAATVREWIALGMPGKTKSGYPIGAQIRWRIDRLKARTPDAALDGEPPKNPKSRKEYFQAERERLKFETETGKLVKIDEHDKIVNGWCAFFIDSLSRMPPTLAPKLAGKNARQANKILSDYCKGLQKTGFGESG